MFAFHEVSGDKFPSNSTSLAPVNAAWSSVKTLAILKPLPILALKILELSLEFHL